MAIGAGSAVAACVHLAVESRRKAECSADADFALYPHPSAHESYKLRTDREPQSRTSIFSSGRRVRLRKRLEDGRLLVFRNANPGIGYGKTERGRFFG